MKLTLFMATILIAVASPMLVAQTPFQENFDIDHSSQWTFNPSPVTDSNADFFFDYSTIGIPPAPNSGGTTRGLKLQSNVFSGVFGGASASPIGQSFTGDYVLEWDMWSNYSGGTFDSQLHGIESGRVGASALSYGGVGSSGSFSNSPGFADGVYFAYTGDGGSAADYRAYSPERAASYQLPPITDPSNPVYCGCDQHSAYFATTRNHTDAYYLQTINPAGDPLQPDIGTVSAPASQIALAASLTPAVDQSGFVSAGTPGFAWRHNRITVKGTTYTWSVDGLDLISVDGSSFLVPLGGSNIFFGHGDINNGSPPEDYRADLFLFTLIDNVRVVVPEPGSIAIVAIALSSILTCARTTRQRNVAG